MENYILRKYENTDYEFVYEVKKNAYKKYVEQYRTYIIMFNDERIGFYQGQVVNERTYYIENICIILEYQGKGIGTEILKTVINAHSDKNIEIQYFKQNPVGNLYKKLGFEPNGETEFHYQMIKRKN